MALHQSNSLLNLKHFNGLGCYKREHIVLFQIDDLLFQCVMLTIWQQQLLMIESDSIQIENVNFISF